MAITFFYSEPRFAIPRSYLRGFTFRDTGSIAPHWNGEAIEGVNAFNVFYHIELGTNVYDWSSNTYTEDYVFDATSSYASILGVPTDPGVLVQIGYYLNEGEWRLICDVSGFGGTQQPLDLPSQPSDFWYPVSP